MTIREIAKLANVSVSTVSKIINDKDDNISSETRNRVLEIVKAYHYTPYASNIAPQTKSWTIGVIFKSMPTNMLILKGILEEAQQNGYNICILHSNSNPDTEYKHLSTLCIKHIDGLIWEPLNEKSLDYIPHLEKEKVPFQLFNIPHEDAYNLDYSNLSYVATQHLLHIKHTNIGYLLHEHAYGCELLEGYKQCLYQHNIIFEPDSVFTEINQTLLNKIHTHTLTAFICSNASLALQLYMTLYSLGYSVPKDLSIICLDTQLDPILSTQLLSTLSLPTEDFATHLCRHLINKLEKKALQNTSLKFVPTLTTTCSIDSPFAQHKKHILVIGSINIDTYLNADHLPSPDNVIKTTNSAIYPGGKAINQAIGISKLGCPVSIIGKVGFDIHTDMIFSALKSHNISTRGLIRHENIDTGKAYIFTNPEGDSMISILEGANAYLKPEDIYSNQSMFNNAQFCLLQTEIPLETVEVACEMAKKLGLQTVLKPSSCQFLPDKILLNTDILIPNVNELFHICPEGTTVEDKAQLLIAKGVQHVIVTMGVHGCFWVSADSTKHYSATNFTTVDSTGASDAFISALTTYLYTGYSLDQAIQVASIAAGFSVQHKGVVPSLITQNILENHLALHMPNLLSH